jgi:hypothetical protein
VPPCTTRHAGWAPPRHLFGSLAGGSGTILTSTPEGNALTPAIAGLLSRQGVPPSAYRAAEGGYDVQGTHDDQGNNDGGDVSWAELQPVAGGPIAGNNAIDQAITDVNGWNAANPAHPELLKVRIVVGIHSPAWALNLGGPCFQVTDPNSNVSACCPRFWTSAFTAAYYQFEAEFAAEYDGNLAIGEIVMAKNTTVYNESLIRQTASPATVAALMAAGYTTGRDALGAQLVLENNSLREGYLAGNGNYQSMYAFMVQVGGPIAFQTSTLGRTGTLSTVLNGAIGLSAGSVELPSGYQTVLTPAQVAAITAGLA